MANWAGLFEGLGEGMDDLRDAKEKTLELEYRNMRDANLRRFQVEDRDLSNTRQDLHREEDRGFQVEDKNRALTETDEASGIGETPRAEAYREKDQQKQDWAIERISKSNEGRSLYGRAAGMTKEKFIDQGMKLVQDQYDEMADPDVVGSGEIPSDVYERSLKVLSDQWYTRQKTLGNDTEEGYTPFNVQDDPDELRGLIETEG